jgi:hypothetical protein
MKKDTDKKFKLNEKLTNMNKTTEKWRQTGLLEYLENETQCDELALSLEQMAHRLLKDVPPYTKESEEFASMILPIVRRVYDEANVFPSTEWLYNDFKQFCVDKKHLKEEWHETAMHKIDAEAEFTAYYVDDVVARLTNP